MIKDKTASTRIIENCRDCHCATSTITSDGTEYYCPYLQKVTFLEWFGDKPPICKSARAYWHRLKIKFS